MDRRIQDKILIKLLKVTILMLLAIVAGLVLHNERKIVRRIDFDLDGECDTFTIYHNTLKIKFNDGTIWKTDETWKVDDFLVHDINNDGRQELLVLFWKKGSFGKYKPFWREDEIDDEYTQHICIYQVEESVGVSAPTVEETSGWDELKKIELSQIWMSSKLIPEIKHFDVNEYGQIHIISEKDVDMIWIWNDWGLERIK